MATKNISLKTEAYNALKRIQLENESFSDTIIRITENLGNLKIIWNKYPKLSDEEYENELTQLENRRKQDFGDRS